MFLKIDSLESSDINLMDGETVQAVLNWTGDREDLVRGDEDLLLLTDRRVVLLHKGGNGGNAAFVAVDDVDLVEVSSERSGYSGWVWGGLAFFVALMLWRTWEHQLGSTLGPIVVMLIGLYLIADQFLSQKKQCVIFRAGSSHIYCSINNSGQYTDAHEFINRLFQLKFSPTRESIRWGKPFARR